ncbi:hypothetical protein [Vibrio scophthalmi]|uniref:Uncharacterized protein n=1 Tax=Vibrio scophthalmi LMG 19158 TaxID=870967 RepID=F9RSV0_9VIBR|nr:hypothetical protein [Vibrio scophthalmi]EGU31650.1 hypothetical protein VIS19158_18866 [Vibrio scophthalmi LMG 19158]
MSNLAQALINIGADQLEHVSSDSVEWQAFCQHNESLFNRVQLAKPEQAFTHHLLGILTKAHIEALSRVEQQRDSVEAMNQAIEKNVGAEHHSRFRYQEGEQLLVITHLWLYVQGYLGMDFSLANDHAQSSVQALITMQGGDSQALRSQLMASFYQGKAHTATSQQQSHCIIQWLKSLFK